MNKLKGIFYAIAAAVLLFTSCEPVQPTYVVSSYSSNIYTITEDLKLAPEFEDTLYRVNNVGDFGKFGLEPGDRAHLILHYYFDAYNGKGGELNIYSNVEEIATLPIMPRGSVDANDYEMPLGLYSYELLYANTYPTWIWDNRLNINVSFAAKPSATDFVMALRGVEKDTVRLDILAKTTLPSDTVNSKLLSYDIKNITEMFTDEEKSALREYEKLTFRIYRKNKKVTGELYDVACGIYAGEYVNPLHN